MPPLFSEFLLTFCWDLSILGMPKQRGGRTICWIPLEGLVVSSKGFNAKEVFF
jgi:hypothetical protein